MERPLKVLHPITRMIVGGAQLNTLYTCQGLDRTRYQPLLLTGIETGPEGHLLSRESPRCPVIEVPTLVRRPQPYLDLRSLVHIRRVLREESPTIVHTHTSKAGILARIAARDRGTPVVIHTAHGWQWTLTESEPMRRFIIASERWAARFTDRIVVVAEGDRDKGLEAGVGRPEQYELIESAIRLDEFDPARVEPAATRRELGIPGDAPVAGTVGRMSHPKEPALMLAAALGILERRPGAHFIYVGDGKDREKVLGALGERARNPRLHLLGLRRDIPALIGAMDVFLLCSSSEGLPRTVVEAMALGKPVVSTPAGAVPELVTPGQTGFLVGFGDEQGLIEAAVSILDDPERGRGLGRTGRSRVVDRFGVDRMVRRIEVMYEAVLSEKR